MQLLKKFLEVKDTQLSLYEQKKVNQLNAICVYSSVFVVILALMNLFLERFPQLIVDISLLAIIYTPVILIQKSGHYSIARNYFTIVALIAMNGICFYNIGRGEFLQTENIYLTLAPPVVILYERIKQVMVYSIVIIFFFGFHTYDYIARNQQILDSNYITNSLVYLIVFLAIHYFVSSYKKAFYNIYLNQTALIDQMAKQKEELSSTNETKNKLFSIVAHDLKRPLNMLTGLLQVQEMIPEKELQDYKKQVKDSVNGISGLVDNLLTWAKSQLEGFQVDMQHTRLNDLFQKELEVYKEQAGVKGIGLDTKIPEKLEVISDPNHVALVIRNIVNNSIKFTPNNGQISIVATEKIDHVDIIIKDTGVGMDEETIRKVREQKFVTSKSGTQGESGSGLGLAMCSETLIKIGGKLLIESKENEGSQFTIQLPLN